MLTFGLDTPIGPLAGSIDNQTLVSLHFSEQEPGPACDHPIAAAIAHYFKGEHDALKTIDARPKGTEFQLAVWAEVAGIACGETASYGDIAERIGRPTAVRAVGAANGKNPIGLVIPCHRVVGAGGTMTGYAWGLERKRWLLTHEGAGDGQQDLFGSLAGDFGPDQVVV